MNKAAMPMAETVNRAPIVEQADDEIDLLELARTLWRGKLWIILALVVFASLGWVYATMIAVPKYTAHASVALVEEQSSVVDLQSITSGLSGDQATINTEVEVLRSRNLLGKLVDQMNLLEDPEFNPFLTSDREPASPQAARDATVDRLAEAISISNVRSSYVFNITVVTTDPQKSADIANSLAEIYIQDQLDVKFEAMETATEWLSDRVASLKIELETAEARLKTFSNSTDLVSVDSLEGLNIQVKETRDRMDLLKSTRDEQAQRLAALEAAATSGDRQTKVQTANDPTLARLADQIDQGNNAVLFDARFTDVLERARADLARSEQQVTSLGNSLERLEADYAQQSDDLVKMQQMEREAESLRGIYEYFLKRMQETSVQRGIQKADSRVLSDAVRPTTQSEPRTALVIALSGILGLIAGAGGVLLREMLQSGFRTADDLESVTGLSVMGQLPKVPSRKRRGVIEYIVEKPTSAAAEAVRNLRTSVVLASLDKAPQVIMSTSSLPGEGKTTTAITLAQNFAGLGKSVLLVEGDIRRRVFSEYFEFEHYNGMLSVLSGTANFDDVVQKNDLLGVDILLGEQSSTNAADVFSSERFSNFIDELRKRYDVIIIDTPPVLLVPDSRIIAHATDAVLFTVKWDSTSKAQVREAVRQFAMAGISITGAVLNQIDPKGMKRYGYGGSYGAYAAYGDNKYYNN